MSAPGVDQQPDSWSRGASGYAERFAGFTGLYADAVLDLLGVAEGTTLLDVACGSGAVTEAALARGAAVVSTDFAEGMVRQLRGRRRAAGGVVPPVAVADAQRLAVASRSFQASVSMFGVMFAPDLGAGIGEMARIVAPGGRVAVGTWSLAGFQLSHLVGEAVARTLPEAPPRPVPAWAPVGAEDGLRRALVGAGLEAVEVHVVTRRWHVVDPEGFFRDGPTWSPPMRPLFDALPADLLAVAAAHFAEVVEAASGTDGLPNDALVAVGTVPR